MRKLRSFDPGRQERWKHRGRTYSIVDLIKAPLEANGGRASDYPDSRFEELMRNHYGEWHFELAEFMEDGVRVLQRYASFEDAREAIESGLCYER